MENMLLMIIFTLKERENDFHYVITSLEGPDLPPWIYKKYTKKDNSLYIFGSPPKNVDVNQLEVSFLSNDQFEIIKKTKI